MQLLQHLMRLSILRLENKATSYYFKPYTNLNSRQEVIHLMSEDDPSQSQLFVNVMQATNTAQIL